MKSLLPALLASACLAPPALALQAAADAALTRALDTISVEELRADLFFLASDEMAGRDTPSPQQRLAARFIRTRLQRLGIEPGGADGSYLWEWTCPQLGMDREATWLAVTGADGVTASYAWGKDYFLTPRSPGKRQVAGEALYCPNLDSASLEGLEVRGRWLVGENTGGISRRFQSALQESGAIGIIVLPQDGAEQTVEESLGRWAQRLVNPRISTRAEDRPGYPVVYLAEDAGVAMRARIPAGARRGDLLGFEIEESCGYGVLGEAQMENVIGLWPGSDPELKDELIILSAHYDHVGVGADGAIYNGADDNGSGTTGMLALAEALTEYGPMRRSVMLMWVSGEEKGLLGSRAWTLDPYLPEGMVPLCNINIDMIGRNAADELAITPTSKHPAYSALTKVAEANAAAEGFGALRDADAYWSRSDHANFQRNLKIPVAFLFSDVHEDYHKPTDTPEKIDYDKMRRVCRLVMRMLHDLQVDRPEF